MIVEMFVGLKVPDNVVITAYNALKRMRYKIKKLEKSDYYKFDVTEVENFKKQISNVDILVNSNKNTFSFTLEQNNNKKQKNNNYKLINVLVQDLDNGNALLETLKERLGFKNIKKLEKGILWTVYFDKNQQARKIAVDITKSLLMNENYQKYKIM